METSMMSSSSSSTTFSDEKGNLLKSNELTQPVDSLDQQMDPERLNVLRREGKRRKKEERRKRRREEKIQHQTSHSSDGNGSQCYSSLGEPFLSQPDGKRRFQNKDANGSTELHLTIRPNQTTIGSTVNGISLPLAADTSKQELQPLMDYSTTMKLKLDHGLRPATVLPTGFIYLDMNGPFSKQASDFLVTIAEPVSRPENIHEFQITVFSLYAAIGIGMTVDEIITNLNKFSKNEVPLILQQLLKVHGTAFGRVKLILRDNRYYLEAETKEDLEYMLSNPTIAEARIRNSTATRQVRTRPTSLKSAMEQMAEYVAQQQASCDGLLRSAEATLDPETLGFKLTAASAPTQHQGPDEQKLRQRQPQKEPTNSAPTSTQIKQVYLFEVNAEKVGKVKECALTGLKRPLVSEYDFRRDFKNPSLDIALKPTTKIRYYQERALRKMFSNGRARSGIIVLPCGAGKTLTGITAATTIRKSAMVLTSSSVAVDQWKRSFTDFTTIDPNCVVALTSEKKQDLPLGPTILCSTYTMMAFSRKRSDAAERIIQQVKSREWGLLIFDEVQFAPAPAFRRINDLVKSHCKLGLTATLVREDELIQDLQWLIGPKLYEANWLELQEAGYLAKVQVSEVWCPMTAEFYKEYLRLSHAKQRKLWVCNPNKLRVCEFLIRFHEARNDKVIVFSDNLFALKEVAFTLKRPFISGEVGMQERMIILGKFKDSNTLNTIFLSKVGDNAIDIPCANVVIQISFNFASRRQEAQRLGRILRPKPKANEEFNAFFYSLVSKDTQEMMYADKRQQFIIDQGYAYKVLPITVFPMESENLVFDDLEKQKEMLRRILQTGDKDMDIETDDVGLRDSEVDPDKVQQVIDEELMATSTAPRKTTLSRMTGRAGMLYREYGKGRTSANVQKEVHPFFKSFYKGR